MLPSLFRFAQRGLTLRLPAEGISGPLAPTQVRCSWGVALASLPIQKRRRPLLGIASIFSI